MNGLKSWIVVLVLVCSAGLAQAQDMGRTPIEDVIRDQIADFAADDLTAAFGHASPAIRQLFRTPENFGRMVREGYPMVWRPGAVRMGPAEEGGGIVRQQVAITDRQGVMHLLEYEMIPAGEGWLINGVRYLGAPEVGV